MPNVGVAVFATAFCVEAVGLRDASRFVVAPDQVHAVRVSQFEAYEERDGFDRKEAAVDIVAWYVGSVTGSDCRVPSARPAAATPAAAYSPRNR